MFGFGKLKAPAGQGWRIGPKWHGMVTVWRNNDLIATFRRGLDALEWAMDRDRPTAAQVETLTDAIAGKVGLLNPAPPELPAHYVERVGEVDTAAWALMQRPDKVLRVYTRRSNAQAAADRLNGHD